MAATPAEADGDIVDNLEKSLSLADDIELDDGGAAPNLLLGDLDWWLGIRSEDVAAFKDYENTYVRFYANTDPASDLAVGQPIPEAVLDVYRRKFYADTSTHGARQTFKEITGRDYDEARRAAIVIQKAVRDWIDSTRKCDHKLVFGPLFAAVSPCGKRFVPMPGIDYTAHSCAAHICPCMAGSDANHVSTCCVCSSKYCSVCGRGCECHLLKIAFPW